MKAVVFAMFLVVCQTLVPIPGKAANNPTRANGGPKQQPNAQQRPTPRLPVKSPAQSKENQDGGQTQSNADAQETVVIRKPISVTVKGSWWNKAYVIATITLVLVGVVGVWFAWRTLLAVERQSHAAEAASEAAKATAEASKAQSEAIITGDRAWILVETGDIPDSFEPDPERLQVLEIRPVVRNSGRTPAWITKGFICTHQIERDEELPPEPDYRGSMSGGRSEGEVSIILGPHAVAQPMVTRIRVNDFEALRRGEKRLYIYGFVDYLDFAKNVRQTRFCITYHVSLGFDALPRGFYLAVDAPGTYTQST